MCRLLWKPLYLKINLDPFFKFQIDEDNVESDDDADDIAEEKNIYRKYSYFLPSCFQTHKQSTFKGL